MNAGPFVLGEHFAQLVGPGKCLPVKVDDAFWETGIAQLPPGRLVTMFESAEDWQVWERHPEGEELIFQIDGEMTLVLDMDGTETRVPLRAGEFAVVAAGIWHSAEVAVPGRALYITPGEGTESRPRR